MPKEDLDEILKAVEEATGKALLDAPHMPEVRAVYEALSGEQMATEEAHEEMMVEFRKHFKRVGRCNRCGRCCTQLGLAEADWQSAYAHYVLSYEAGALELGETFEVWLERTCPLLEIKDGKPACMIYEKRPQCCQDFPEVFKELVPGCGFNFKRREEG